MTPGILRCTVLQPQSNFIRSSSHDVQQWRGAGDASTPPKFWCVECPGNIPENLGENDAQRLQENKRRPFFGGHTKKKDFMIFVGGNL